MARRHTVAMHQLLPASRLVAVLFCLVTSVSAQVVLTSSATRQATRLLFAGGFERSAEVCIHYGAPTWRAEHADALEGDKAVHYRLGNGFWTTLHTNVEVRFGGKRVPASVWYLGLHRAADNKWHLSLMDSAKLHRTGLGSGSTRDAIADLLVPMILKEDLQPVKQLRIDLVPGGDKGKPGHGELRLRWGPYQLSTDLIASIKVANPVDEPKFAPFDEGRVVTTKSGLRYQELRPGVGKSPLASSKVTVNYVGWNTDGTRFDSSFLRKQASEFPLNRVIAGWTEGIALMRPGAVFRFEIPPKLAYGKRGVGPIKPDSTLVFWVELLKFE